MLQLSMIQKNSSKKSHHSVSQSARARRVYNKHKRNPASKSSLSMASTNRCVTKRKGRETDINWGDADPDILFSIFNRLPSLVDLHRAKSVCWGWNKAATRNKVSSLPAEMPWLIFTPFEKSSYFGGSNQVDHDRYCRFLIMEERKFYPFNHRAVEKMDGGCWYCCGSSCGWLVCLDKVAVPFLLNPFTSQIINLPPMDFVKKVFGTGHGCFLRDSDIEISIQRNHFVKKAALSSSPATNKCYHLVIIYGIGSRLGFFRGRNKSWIMLDSEAYCDIIFHQNHLYALSQHVDYVRVWDMNNQHPVRRISIEFEENIYMANIIFSYENHFYLVESQGSLLVVQRIIEEFLKFKVFKLDNEQKICRRMKCLPKGIALFLGRNQSFSMEVRNSNVFKQNMIYFTDDSHGRKATIDRRGRGYDSGVFALKGKRVVDWLYGNKIENQQSPPTWLLPCISS